MGSLRSLANGAPLLSVPDSRLKSKHPHDMFPSMMFPGGMVVPCLVTHVMLDNTPFDAVAWMPQTVCEMVPVGMSLATVPALATSFVIVTSPISEPSAEMATGMFAVSPK